MKLNSEPVLALSLAAFLTILFAVSVVQRPLQIPAEKGVPQTWLTCNTVKFARNWDREGALALRFRLIHAPLSVETPELNDRVIYASYPPGSVMLAWLAAKIAGVETSIQSVAPLNLAIHLLTALVLAGIALNLLTGMSFGARFAGGAGAGFFYLCAGAPFYLHWIGYFADTAILLPVAAVVWLESFGVAGTERPAWVRLALPVAVFCGSLTDALMVILAGTIALWRLIVAGKENRGKAFRGVLAELALPVFLAVSLFFLQLATGGVLNNLAHTFATRSFVDAGPVKVPNKVPFMRFLSHFRLPDILLLAIPCLAAVLVRLPDGGDGWRKMRGRTALIGVLLTACAAQMTLFWSHTYVHPFSVLKLYAPASLLLGVAIAFGVGNGRHLAIKFTAGILFLAFLIPGIWRHELGRATGGPDYPFMDVVRHLSRTASYRDVYLSPVITITRAPPQLLSFTMKYVWGVKTRQQVDEVLAGVRGQPCTLHFLVQDTPEIAALFSTVPCTKTVLSELTDYAIDGSRYPGIASRMDALFVGQDVLFRKLPRANRKKAWAANLVPWVK